MLRILLVDDEPLVRISIKSIIDWETEDCEIIGEASNGQTALALFHEKKADVILTDIRMPVMDGLELLNALRDEKTAFILLSGYDDFKYVSEALRLGACDYLLKMELNEVLLRKALQNARKRIGFTRYEKGWPRAVLRRELLKRILLGELHEMDEPHSDEYLGKLVGSRQLRLMVMRGQTSSDMASDIMDAHVLNIIDETFHHESLVTTIASGWYAAVFNADAFQNEDLKRICVRIQSMVSQYCAMNIRTAAGQIVSDWRDLPSQWNRCRNQIWSRIDLRSGEIIWYEQQAPAKAADAFHWGTLLRELQDGMERQNGNEVKRCLVKCGQMMRSLCENVYDLRARLDTILHTASRSLSEPGSWTSIQEQAFGKVITLSEIETIEQAVELLYHLCDVLTALFDHMPVNASERIVSSMKRYARENLREHITLDCMARHLSMNASYLSGIFVKSEGYGFFEYLSRLRVEEAKRLLTKEDIRVSEVAYDLGFSNAFHFSKVFKRYTRQTPTEYRNKHTGGFENSENICNP